MAVYKLSNGGIMESITLYTQDTGVRETSRISELIEAFISEQDVKSSSKETYKMAISRFIEWVTTSNYSMDKLTRVEILLYKDSLILNGLSVLSVSTYLTAVRRFYEWAEAHKYYPNIAKGVKSPKSKRQFRKQALTQSQSEALIAYLSGKSVRDFAIINLLIRTGLRTIEVIRANVGDIVFKGGKRVLLIQGKGRDAKDSFVKLTDKTYNPIREYLASRSNPKDSDPLFISESNNSKGQRLNTRTIRQVAKESLRAIGLDDKAYTAHSLRHTTAVNILRAGGAMGTVQQVLRHASINTSEIYTATIAEEMRLKTDAEELIDNLF